MAALSRTQVTTANRVVALCRDIQFRSQTSGCVLCMKSLRRQSPPDTLLNFLGAKTVTMNLILEV